MSDFNPYTPCDDALEGVDHPPHDYLWADQFFTCNGLHNGHPGDIRATGEFMAHWYTEEEWAKWTDFFWRSHVEIVQTDRQIEEIRNAYTPGEWMLIATILGILILIILAWVFHGGPYINYDWRDK